MKFKLNHSLGRYGLIRRLNFHIKGTIVRNKSSQESGGANSNFKDRFKLTLSKISGAFMLPISVMAIGGLFLGVGASIETQATGNWKIFGNFIKQLGSPVFNTLPLLFAVAFVIAFTEEAGVGVFATIIGYCVFSSIQSVFIFPESGVDNEYTILFKGAGRLPKSLGKLIGSTLGIRCLQTSVFGGLIVGLVMSKLYNKFHTIQLPTMIAFFGGKRFVALIGIIAMIPLAFLFLIFWPWIGAGLNQFGLATGKIKYGFESFIFGYIERSLVPFGLHHAFYAPLWYTSAGGDFEVGLDQFYEQMKILGGNKSNWTDVMEWTNDSKTFIETYKTTGGYQASNYQGDSTLAAALLKLPFNHFEWKLKSGITLTNDPFTAWKVSSSGQNEYKVPVLNFVSDVLNIRIGRYTQGKYPFMQFGLPAAAAAMLVAAPKENRKLALSAVVPSAATSMITGVTEPIEFTFLFLSPFLFWGFHAFMCALSFMLMNVAGAHIGQVFSGGLLDLFVYGVLPFQKGTRFWIYALIGLAYAPIYFFFFLFWIKHKNLATPGRQGQTRLYTRKDYNKSVQAVSNTTTSSEAAALNKDDSQQIEAIIEGVGGFDNLTKINNCASRLRLDVVDRTKVDEAKLKTAGVFGVRWIGEKHCQLIVGTKAEQLAANIRKIRNNQNN